jgi:hypothetical protein
MILSGFVYAYRYGDGDHVKIGKSNDLNKRRRTLQGAHHNPLVLVDSIEHDDYQACRSRTPTGRRGRSRWTALLPGPSGSPWRSWRRTGRLDMRADRQQRAGVRGRPLSTTA